MINLSEYELQFHPGQTLYYPHVDGQFVREVKVKECSLTFREYEVEEEYVVCTDRGITIVDEGNKLFKTPAEAFSALKWLDAPL